MEKIENQQKGKWLQLVVTTSPVLVEAISDFMVGILGAAVEVSVEDAIEERVVNGFLEQKDMGNDEITQLTSQLEVHLVELAEIFNLPVPQLTTDIIVEEDWSNNWKKHFKPFQVIPGMVISPSWEQYQPKEGEQVIEMDPGMAFGTGHHPTTSMSIALIKKSVSTLLDAKVLDVGTGTGVLGMAAVLLGAGETYGVDNDPEAVFAAAENIKHNKLDQDMHVSGQDLETVDGQYELVVANIIHDVLQLLRADLVRVTAPQGQLVLSGLLAGEQVDSIVNSFTEDGTLKLLETITEGEWAALRMERVK